VDKSAEPFPATDPIEREDFARTLFLVWWRRGERRSLAKRAVRSMLVVVQRIGGHYAFEMPAAQDQQPVETLAAKAANPALVPAVPVRAP
jgi:hypothetical protein